MRAYKVTASDGDYEEPSKDILTFVVSEETDEGMSEGFRKALGSIVGLSEREVNWWCQEFIDEGRWRYTSPISWLNLMRYNETESYCLWVEPIDAKFV